ncbi:MAG: tryptophan synthase subunit alpha [Pyrinomonadaceae bacterium]|nr:tryptophan synthase subunit alpha [Pyrinomonadaceae bacterium]
MNNRIIEKFSRLKSDGRGGFIPFIVAGDPDLQTTKSLIIELCKADATVIELGVPFSDPVADGVTIQTSAERALRKPIAVRDILEIVADVRVEGFETPIILFSYFNPILQFGLKEFAEKAKATGVDGCLITDLVPEEAEEFRAILAEKELCLIMLAAPTSSDERLQKICDKASGFVYAVSRAGVTGARTETSSDAKVLVSRIRKFTGLPIALGFGISNASQVEETWKFADAAVVGSAIVAEMIKSSPNPDSVEEDFVEKIGDFVKKLLP